VIFFNKSDKLNS